MALYDRPVRMPLQTGAVALKTVGMTAILFPVLWTVVPAVVLFLMARDARRRRADDIVFTSEGFELRGGRRDGMTFSWNTVDPDAVRLVMTKELFVQKGNQPARYIQRLKVGKVTIAESAEDEEIASFEAVIAMIRARLRPVPALGPVQGGGVVVEICPTCGAPLVPTDEDRFRCERCRATGPMPTALRARIHDAAAVTRAQANIERMVRRILARGKASTTNWAIAAFGFGLYVSVAVAALAAYRTHQPAWLLGGLALPLVLAGFARLLVAHRRALRDLTRDYGAIESGEEDAPPACRMCCAPLPAIGPSQVVVRCVYCAATNVLGVGIGPRREAVGNQEADLQSLLEDQQSGTIWAFTLSACGVMAGALSAWILNP